MQLESLSERFYTARKQEKIVRDWLDKQGLENDTVHDNWIDCIEMGHGDDIGFIDFLKQYNEGD